MNQEAWKCAIELACAVAPTREDRTKLRRLAVVLRREDRLKQFVGTIYDGLAYGNWPTTTYRSEK